MMGNNNGEPDKDTEVDKELQAAPGQTVVFYEYKTNRETRCECSTSRICIPVVLLNFCSQQSLLEKELHSSVYISIKCTVLYVQFNNYVVKQQRALLCFFAF